MRITDVVNLARKKVKANSTTFSDSDMLLYIKAKLPIFQTDIEAVNEDYFGSIEYRDLIATGTGVTTVDEVEVLTREYNLPSDMIPRLNRVYAKLDGSNWIALKEYDEVDISVPFKEDNIKSRFDNSEGIAGYHIFRGSLFILSGEIEEDIENGLEIWTYAFTSIPGSIPTAGSDDDVEMEVYGIPESLQELFAVALGMEWKSNQAVPIPFNSSEANFYALYDKELKKLKGLNRSREIAFEKPRNSYDNGFNL